MKYWEPSKAVTGKWPARSKKRAVSRNFDDGWMVARSLIDGCWMDGCEELNRWVLDLVVDRQELGQELVVGRHNCCRRWRGDGVVPGTCRGAVGGLGINASSAI